jgi:hypothetical protein
MDFLEGTGNSSKPLSLCCVAHCLLQHLPEPLPIGFSFQDDECYPRLIFIGIATGAIKELIGKVDSAFKHSLPGLPPGCPLIRQDFPGIAF